MPSANDPEVRKQLLEDLAQAELELAQLRTSGNPLGREGKLFEYAGRLRHAIETIDRERGEVKASAEQLAQDELARRCLALTEQLEDLRGRRGAAGDEDLLREQLELAWAHLGEEGRAWVNEHAAKRRR